MSLFGLPFLLLLSIPVSIIIKFEDRGSVFFCSNRQGKNGIPFKMYKFRSMKMNAPDIRNADGSTYNGENDPRLTRIGRILRETSVDELPQLLNVLKGDMSFVGPRPNLADTPISQFDLVRRKRVTARPGLTGYNQAYFRNSIPMNEKFVNDCYYIDNISFLFDIKIICKTVFSVIKHEKIFIER
jgi:lipopolysaccharide/colanic/teichoic acid biosynthesis glycosyltransferase